MTAKDYVDQVADQMPRMMPEREQILTDVRAHIDEHVQRGELLATVLAKLGPPATLADSYLSEVPRVSAPFWRRAAAKIIDFLVALAIVAPLVLIVWFAGHGFTLGVPEVILLCPLLLAISVLVGETRYGQTLGKHWMHLLVVQESGARISIGQAIVRQLPWVFQVFWLDAFFALFTEKHQRAFELLSKTRVVLISPERAKLVAQNQTCPS